MLSIWELRNGKPAANAVRPWGPQGHLHPWATLSPSKHQQKNQQNTYFALLCIWVCLLNTVFFYWPVSCGFGKCYRSVLVLLWAAVSTLESGSHPKGEIIGTAFGYSWDSWSEPSSLLYFEEIGPLRFSSFPCFLNLSWKACFIVSLCWDFCQFLGLKSVYINHFRKIRDKLTQ